MEKVDLILTNANILTLDSSNTIAGSLAVAGGNITGIWKQPEPTRHEMQCHKNTEILNLKGATVLPGFIDTHNHILEYALTKKRVDCSSPKNKSILDILEAIKHKQNITPYGEWIIGYGYDDTLLKEQRHPNKFELDRVSPNHPVLITHISGHLAVANSKAIELVGVENGGYVNQALYGMMPNGELDGVLFEQGIDPFYEKIPIPSEDEMVILLEEASKDFMATGITTSTDASVGAYFGMKEFDVHFKAARSRVNPMRMKLMIMHTLLKDNAPFASYDAEALKQEFVKRSNGFVELDSVKLFQDGSIQGLTGALREPYYTVPSKTGELFHEQQAFNEEILNLHNRGYRIAIHGNGDRAIGSILEGFQHALKRNPRIEHRHRIEHVQTVTLDDLDKMKEHRIAGSFFINHVYYWGDRHKRLFLGPERAGRLNPINDAIDRNLLFTLHSDCPVTPISPLFSVWAAVNRVTSEGELLGKSQRCDVWTALKAMTIYGAKLNFDEKKSGSIEIGKFADFAVLEEDPTKVNPLEMKDIPILRTIIDGNVRYEKK